MSVAGRGLSGANVDYPRNGGPAIHWNSTSMSQVALDFRIAYRLWLSRTEPIFPDSWVKTPNAGCSDPMPGVATQCRV